VIYLDADTLPLRNIDHFFREPLSGDSTFDNAFSKLIMLILSIVRTVSGRARLGREQKSCM
jgi:alpha-N-acetylglucosamine transferase